MPVNLGITRPEDFDRLIAELVAAGAGHSAELLRIARTGKIAVVNVQPTVAAPMKTLRHMAIPTIVIVGDDPRDDASQGPAGWLPFRRLLQWGSYAVLHAAAGEVAHYRAIAELTVLHRRLILIETTTADLDAWAQRLHHARPRPMPFMLIAPIGASHPVAEAAAC